MTVVRFRVRLKGRGRADVTAYGLSDAEHLVEKEWSRLWPEARVGVLEVSRSGGGAIAGEFSVGFVAEVPLEVETSSSDAARSAAFREARRRVDGTRYRFTEWEAAKMEERRTAP